MVQLIDDNKLKEVYDTLIEKDVVGFIAPTGGGKSTRLIKYLCDRKIGRLFVMEPTIEAVKHLYRYVSKTNKVGYAAEGEIHYKNTDKIVYCTGGHLENKLRSYFDLGEARNVDFCDLIVIDEAHRGSLEQDIILGLYKEALRQNVKMPKVLVMSATLSIKEIPFNDIPLITVNSETKFKVNVEYTDKELNSESRDFYDIVTQTVSQRHVNEEITKQNNCWLIFVPGIREVLYLAYSLNTLSSIEIVKMASGIPEDERNRILEPIPSKIRRIIVATNLAEAAITIEGLSGIFDTMLEKYGETSINGGFKLTLGNISKSSAKQRAGRTGRTCPGFCYRFCTEAQFARLPEQRIPEILRIPLHTSILRNLSIGLTPFRVLGPRINCFTNQKDRNTVTESIEHSVESLERLNMITIDVKNETVKVEHSGEFASRFPLSVRSSAILWQWINLQDTPEFPGIVMAAIIELYDGSLLYFPRKEENNQTAKQYALFLAEYYEKNFKHLNGKSDLESLIRLWHYIMKDFGTINPKITKIKNWCVKNSINAKKAIELLSLVRQIMRIFTSMSNEPPIVGLFSPRGVLDRLIPILQEVYDDSICKRNGKGEFVSLTGQKCSISDRNRPSTSITASKEIYCISHIEIIRKRIITLFFTANINDLPDEGPVFNKNEYSLVAQEEEEPEDDIWF